MGNGGRFLVSMAEKVVVESSLLTFSLVCYVSSNQSKNLITL